MPKFVSELMLRDVAVLTPHTPLREATQRMSRSGRGLVVVADEDRVYGVVTMRHLVFGAEVAAQGQPVHGIGDLASRRFILTWEGESLEELAPRFVQAGVRRAVVMSRNWTVAGVITTAELAQGARRRWRSLHAVDVSSEDSFPASDPPSWTGTLAG